MMLTGCEPTIVGLSGFALICASLGFLAGVCVAVRRPKGSARVWLDSEGRWRTEWRSRRPSRGYEDPTNGDYP